ncbi:MAG: S8 family serine peptidase, partial [Pyrinomonadaceae bacterium]
MNRSGEMNSVLKIFATGAEQETLAGEFQVLERYDGFVLVEVPEAMVKKLARTYLLEDITSLYTISIGRREIDTSTPRIDAAGAVRAHPVYRGVKALAKGRHHYLVQFVGPIKEGWLAGVRKAGGEPRELHSNFAYVVRADEAAVKKIAALPYVRWTGHLPHSGRVAQALAERLGGESDGAAATLPRTRLLPDVYTVEFFGPKDVENAVAEVKKLGFNVLVKEAPARILVVEAKGGGAKRRRQIEDLSAVHGVRKIRQRAINRPSNDVAARIMGTALSMGNSGGGLGLSGKGEYVAVCDTGLDTGRKDFIHRDFAKRVSYIKSYPVTPEYDPFINNPGGDDGAADLDTGHGTHVAGSVLGNGAACAGVAGITAPIRGLAYDARLVFQAVEQELDWKDPEDLQKYGRYGLAGIPVDLRDLFRDAYRKKVRVHSNSWGGGDPGVYDDQCRQLDQFVWDNKDFCV